MSSEGESTQAALALQTLHQQLGRMREMHGRYSNLFYELVIISLIVIILMGAASMTDALRGVVLLIPFYVIYVGVHSAYYLSYVVWARIYATGLEQKINELLKENLLIAHRQEAVYLFPLQGKQFAGVRLSLRQTFIGFITIHFWITGAAAIGLSLYRAWQLYEELIREFPPACYYFIALGVWALLHLVYLVWYFGARPYERRVMEIVREAYGTNYDNA